MRKRGIPCVLAIAAILTAGPVLAQEQEQERGNAERGRAYAETNCAECHEVRRGHFDSPNPEAPVFQDIANAEGMTEIALYAFFRISHPSMPNLIVPPDDIADLTAYLMSIRQRQ